jgi:hypothetical protein
MIASLIYYTILKNLEISFGRKISFGLLGCYIGYYLLFVWIFENKIYGNWFYWILGLDTFVLAVLLVKYKNLNWKTFISKATNNVLAKS